MKFNIATWPILVIADIPPTSFELMHQLVLLCTDALLGNLYVYVWQPHKRSKPTPEETSQAVQSVHPAEDLTCSSPPLAYEVRVSPFFFPPHLVVRLNYYLVSLVHDTGYDSNLSSHFVISLILFLFSCCCLMICNSLWADSI